MPKSPVSPQALPTIDTFLEQPLTVGEPDLAGPLAVFPVFGGPPRLEYTSFGQSFSSGTTIKEIASGASVNDLTVSNAGGLPVLLYEGEEVLGAQQNRTFDVTVLVAAGKNLSVPVSCVEAGRWDGRRHQDAFRPAPQMSYPELRRLKNRRTHEMVASGQEARASQSEVWAEIDAKSQRLHVESPSHAVHDVFEQRRDSLGRMALEIALRENQIGSLVAIGGTIKVLDVVSRPDVFSAIHPALVQGYALDALEAAEGGAPSLGDAQGFVSLATGSRADLRPSIGLGNDLRFAADGVAGSGLMHDGELVQLNAFPE